MKTDIVIATHRRPTLVTRLLDNLSGCDLPPEVSVRVVENGPRCGVEDIVRSHGLGSRASYAYLPVGMKSLALNAAIEASAADFFIFFDDDVTVEPDIVANYVAAAVRCGPGHFFGGGLVAEAETPCPPRLVPYVPRSAKGWAYADRDTAIPAAAFDFFFGANWAAFGHDLRACGLFSPDLGIAASGYSSVGEEEELQQRMAAAGVQPVFLTSAAIRHPVPAECYTVPWLWRRRFRLGVAEWTTRHEAETNPRRTAAGVPLWLFPALGRQLSRRTLALFRPNGLAVRTEAMMEQAHVLGVMYGAWTAHRRRRRAERCSGFTTSDASVGK